MIKQPKSAGLSVKRTGFSQAFSKRFELSITKERERTFLHSLLLYTRKGVLGLSKCHCQLFFTQAAIGQSYHFFCWFCFCKVNFFGYLLSSLESDVYDFFVRWKMVKNKKTRLLCNRRSSKRQLTSTALFNANLHTVHSIVMLRKKPAVYKSWVIIHWTLLLKSIEP